MSQFDVYFEDDCGTPILGTSIAAENAKAAVDAVCDMKGWNVDRVWAVPAGSDPVEGRAAQMEASSEPESEIDWAAEYGA